jgi:hypothetical protein
MTTQSTEPVLRLYAFVTEADAYLEQNRYLLQILLFPFLMMQNDNAKHAAHFVKPGDLTVFHKVCNTFCWVLSSAQEDLKVYGPVYDCGGTATLH